MLNSIKSEPLIHLISNNNSPGVLGDHISWKNKKKKKEQDEEEKEIIKKWERGGRRERELPII